MKLRYLLLRELARLKLIEWKPDYYNKVEREYYDWREEQLRKLKTSEEIEPPWRDEKIYTPTWSGSWRQGKGEYWLFDIWYPFWKRLIDEQKRAYLEKWKAPPEDWYQMLVYTRKFGPNEDEFEWLKEQKEKAITNGEEIEPPWIAFPISLASVGWDDESLEGWKLDVWIPFWERLSEEERKAYLEKWQPPSKEWEENITTHWVGKIRKTEHWFERQKFFLENQGVYLVPSIWFPWWVFPEIPAKETVWDKAFIERWLTEVWLPFWNGMNEEKQDEYLERQYPPNAEWLQILSKYEVKNLNKLKQMKPPRFG